MTTINFETMSKIELRAACKAAGIAGYSKMDNARMRAALVAHAAPAQADEAAAAVVTPATEEAAPAAASVPAPLEAAAVPAARAPTEKKAPVQRVPTEERNGVKKPGKGVCRDVWDALDALMTSSGAQPTAKDVRELATLRSWNLNNAQIESARWRKFNGLAKKQQTKEAKSAA